MPLPITVVSDIVCPWCFIGHRRLREALDRLPEVEARIDWRPYQLHPYIPREGTSFEEHYQRKFGGNVEMLRGRMQEAGESAGIDFQFDLIERVPNTLAAHTVVSWAKEGEARSAVVERFFEGYFLEGQDGGARDAAPAVGVGLGCDALSIVISPEPFGDLGSVEARFGSQRCEDIMVAHILALEEIPREESFDDGASRLALFGPTDHRVCGDRIGDALDQVELKVDAGGLPSFLHATAQHLDTTTKLSLVVPPGADDIGNDGDGEGHEGFITSTRTWEGRFRSVGQLSGAPSTPMRTSCVYRWWSADVARPCARSPNKVETFRIGMFRALF
ncbi:MAG: DsbA family oxidoreductase [Deltaproteobacteria bacterium]|nr:DsbA family oxidoreductase [Deltaproteobacteria bacterium]